MSINDLTQKMRDRLTSGSQTDNSGNDDLGLGDKVGRKPGTRLINQDGNFNVERTGSTLYAPYQKLVEMSWPAFLLLVFLLYLAINAVFAVGFLVIGLDQLSGINQHGGIISHFAHAFFFSVQTFTTVGYGAISPISVSANLLSSLTALSGLLSVALATGLVFARFAQPRAQIAFSQRALIGPYRNEGLSSLQFRIANLRDTNLINLKANVVLSWLENDEGKTSRRFAPLQLERRFVALFPLNWTIVHPITKDSPIHDWSKKDFCQRHSEILIMIEGYDQTYAQTVHANSSYTHDEVVWNTRFVPMYFESETSTILQLDLIDEMEEE